MDAPVAVAPDTGGVAARLRQLLEDGHFPPGSRLPPERSLADQFGVGRPAVREAIKALSALGLLESRQRAGTFVTAGEGGEPGAEEAGFGALEWIEARKILEPRAAWLAAARATEQHLLEIETARRTLEAHDQDWRLVAKLDLALHAAIVRAAGNPALDVMFEALVARALRSRNLLGRSRFDVGRMRSGHKAIVDAIVLRHAGQAEGAMLEHLQSLSMDLIAGARG